MQPSSLITIFIFAFAVSIGAVVSPGPVSAAIISETPRRGWRVGPLVATGHVALELLFIILISVGLTVVLAQPKIQQVIAFTGGILLLYMGLSYIWAIVRGRVSSPDAIDVGSRQLQRNLIGLGILTTISNPFWYAWWATVVPGYLSEVSDFGLSAIPAFYLGHISADYLWDTFLSVTVAAGRRWLTSGRYKALILITGGFMIYLGFVFVRQGLIQ